MVSTVGWWARFVKRVNRARLIMKWFLLADNCPFREEGIQIGYFHEHNERVKYFKWQVAIKLCVPTKQQAEEHYADLSKKPFFGGLTTFFSSGVTCIFAACVFTVVY